MAIKIAFSPCDMWMGHHLHFNEIKWEEEKSLFISQIQARKLFSSDNFRKWHERNALQLQIIWHVQPNKQPQSPHKRQIWKRLKDPKLNMGKLNPEREGTDCSVSLPTEGEKDPVYLLPNLKLPQPSKEQPPCTSDQDMVTPQSMSILASWMLV